MFAKISGGQLPGLPVPDKTPFSLIVMFKMLLLFLIVIISMMHDFLSFYIVVSKCEEWKENAFLRSAPGDS